MKLTLKIMKKRIQINIFCLSLVCVLPLLRGVGLCSAQNIGINSTGATPNVSAALDVDMTNKGLLIPRVSLTDTADVTTITQTAVGASGTWATCRNSCVAMGAGWRMPTWNEEVFIGSGALGTPAGGWIAGYVWTSTPTDVRVDGTLNGTDWMVLNESRGHGVIVTYASSNGCRCVR